MKVEQSKRWMGFPTPLPFLWKNLGHSKHSQERIRAQQRARDFYFPRWHEDFQAIYWVTSWLRWVAFGAAPKQPRWRRLSRPEARP